MTFAQRHFDEAIVRHWQQERKSFIQFVHLLLADLNYWCAHSTSFWYWSLSSSRSLDDAFEKLGTIARTEAAMRDPMEYGCDLRDLQGIA